MLWYVPKKLRAKADQPWRYGVFLGRVLGSDQDFVGMRSGDVVRARALVRLVPAARWDSDMLLAITTTPLTEHNRWLDSIEADGKPHEHSALDDGEGHATPPTRKVRITLRDVNKHGFTDMCPRCNCHRMGNHQRENTYAHRFLKVSSVRMSQG